MIKIERSGGLTGIRLCKVLDTTKLPSSLQNKLTKMTESPRHSTLKNVAAGASDHYVYKISIVDGSKQKTIECTEYDLSDDIKTLIKYAEKTSK
jgi:hypothetical protein